MQRPLTRAFIAAHILKSRAPATLHLVVIV